jgi:hypothetical protein
VGPRRATCPTRRRPETATQTVRGRAMVGRQPQGIAASAATLRRRLRYWPSSEPGASPDAVTWRQRRLGHGRDHAKASARKPLLTRKGGLRIRCQHRVKSPTGPSSALDEGLRYEAGQRPPPRQDALRASRRLTGAAPRPRSQGRAASLGADAGPQGPTDDPTARRQATPTAQGPDVNPAPWTTPLSRSCLGKL